MRSVLNVVMYPLKQLAFAHYVLFVNLTTPRSRMAEIDRRCDAMHQRMFGHP